MPIELTDEITPLGAFPLLNDSYLKGGWQTVLNGTARDAISAASRKVGMVVYTTATSQAWVLGPGITNSDWSLYTSPIAAHASSHIPGGSDALSTAAPTQGIGGGNSVGTGTSFARNDHDHKLRTTTGPTDLTIGAIADGEFLKRVGTAVVSAPPLGGSTASRPVTPAQYTPYFDTSLGIPVWYFGAVWVNASGATV